MIYQQGTQRIEVIVRKESDDVQGANETLPDEAQETKTADVQSGGGGDGIGWKERRRKRMIKTNVTHFMAVSRQIANNAFEHYVSFLGEQNGDQAYQQSVERKIELIKDPTNVASAVAMGALYGSWGGAPGAVLGATMALVSTASSIGFKYLRRQKEYDFKMFKEEHGIEYQRARANINLTTGRLR